MSGLATNTSSDLFKCVPIAYTPTRTSTNCLLLTCGRANPSSFIATSWANPGELAREEYLGTVGCSGDKVAEAGKSPALFSALPWSLRCEFAGVGTKHFLLLVLLAPQTEAHHNQKYSDASEGSKCASTIRI